MKICSVLGTPTANNVTQRLYNKWPDAVKLSAQAGISFPNCQPVALEKIITNCSSDAIAVIQDMLKYDP